MWAVHRQLPWAAPGSGDGQGVLVLDFPPEAELGIKVQNSLIGKKKHAVTPVCPIPEHLLHETLCQALSPAVGPGHDGAQLDVPAALAVQEHLQPVDGDIGQGGFLGQERIGQVGLGPVAALVPALEGEAENLPGQSVKALPGGRIRHDVFSNFKFHGAPCFQKCEWNLFPPETWGLPGR